VRAFSVTTGRHVELESGLEHDLLRVLDRDAAVAWMISQPFELGWATSGATGRRRHTPDLLSVDVEDRVTVWDVKHPDAAASDRFARDRDVTQLACESRGWTYKVFTGLPTIQRHNLLWLQPYRRRPPWAARYESDVAAEAASGTQLGTLLRASEDPERSAVIWHLIWTGCLIVDLADRLSATTQVTT